MDIGTGGACPPPLFTNFVCEVPACQLVSCPLLLVRACPLKMYPHFLNASYVPGSNKIVQFSIK